jgi:hypothetical protein
MKIPKKVGIGPRVDVLSRFGESDGMSGDAVQRIEAQLKEHERRIRELEERITTLTHPSALTGGRKDQEAVAISTSSTAPTASLRQFVVGKNPTDDVQRSLVIGYYLEKHAAYPFFNAKDLEKGFQDAREKVPANVADKILKNVWKGHMMQVNEEKDGLKAYVLTNTGTKFVENGFK